MALAAKQLKIVKRNLHGLVSVDYPTVFTDQRRLLDGSRGTHGKHGRQRQDQIAQAKPPRGKTTGVVHLALQQAKLDNGMRGI